MAHDAPPPLNASPPAAKVAFAAALVRAMVAAPVPPTQRQVAAVDPMLLIVPQPSTNVGRTLNVAAGATVPLKLYLAYRDARLVGAAAVRNVIAQLVAAVLIH